MRCECEWKCACDCRPLPKRAKGVDDRLTEMEASFARHAATAAALWLRYATGSHLDHCFTALVHARLRGVGSSCLRLKADGCLDRHLLDGGGGEEGASDEAEQEQEQRMRHTQPHRVIQQWHKVSLTASKHRERMGWSWPLRCVVRLLSWSLIRGGVAG